MSKDKPVFFDESGRRQKIVDFVLLALIFLFTFALVFIGYNLRKISKIEQTAKLTHQQPRESTLSVLYTESNANAYALLGDRIQQIGTVLLPRYYLTDKGVSTPLTYEKLDKSLKAESTNINTSYDTYHILSSKNYTLPPVERNLPRAIDSSMVKLIGDEQMAGIASGISNADASGLYVDIDLSQISSPKAKEEFGGWLTRFKSALSVYDLHLGLIVDPGLLDESHQALLRIPRVVYSGQSTTQCDKQIQGLKQLKELDQSNVIVELPTASTKTDLRASSRSEINVEYGSTAELLLNRQVNNRSCHSIDVKEGTFSYKVNDAISSYNYLVATNNILGVNKSRGWAISDPGNEEYTLWSLLDSDLTQQTISQLIGKEVKASLSVEKDGAGQIFSLANVATTGSRDITFDSSGYVTTSRLEHSDTANTITKQGESKKKIALTFDDGPNPTYTPKVMDILESYGVRGTFFVIGQNVANYPETARQIVARGHEIENHSYNHPVYSLLDNEANKSQIKSTNEIIELITGVRPSYFRKPYSDNSEITNSADIEYLNMLSSLGLQASEYDIDSKDWLLDTSDQILERVKSQIEASNGKYSQILLHDIHHKPELTMETLPRIIEYLQTNGIEIVTVNQLADQPKSKPNVDAVAEASTPYYVLRTKLWALKVFSVIGVFFIILSYIRYSWMIGGSIFYYVKRKLLKFLTKHIYLRRGSLPKLAIIIACYNEEKVIGKTIEALQKSTYKNFRIILVNDGSKDKTKEIIEAYSKNDKRISLINVPNGGKARALECAMSNTKCQWLVFCDADTIFAPDSLQQFALSATLDYRLGAIAAKIVVGNDYNLLTRAQLIEYGIAHTFIKASQDVTNMITVVPGAAGLWRHNALKKAGGFLPDTLAEDADATMRVIASGSRVGFRANIEAFTEAPEKLTMLFKQRTRWQLGNMQSIYKHRKGLFNPKVYGTLGAVGLPMFYLELITAIAFPFIMLFTIHALYQEKLFGLKGLLAIMQQPDLNLTVFFGILMVLIEIGIVLFVIATSKKSVKSKVLLLLTVPYYITVYKIYLSTFTIVAMLRALKGKMHGWGHLQRTARVNI